MGYPQRSRASGVDVSCPDTWTTFTLIIKPMLFVCRFFDDHSKARHQPQRHYAFRKDHKPIMSENRWATFLNEWTAYDLGTATNLVCAHVCADLTADEHELLVTLRRFHDVLLLDEKDPLHAYQTRLRSLHQLGMINLSFPRPNELISQLLREKRSLVARLREANKRNVRTEKALKNVRNQCVSLQEQLDERQRQLVRAQAQLMSFRSLNPDWTPPDKEELTEQDHDDATKMFNVVDTDLDVKKQMQYDPSGALTCFWEEQRKQLACVSARGRRWNPQVCMCVFIFMCVCCHVLTCSGLSQVLRYCFFLWLCLGNSKFDRLRDVLVLPSRRRLQLFKSKIPSGDGIRKDVFTKLGM